MFGLALIRSVWKPAKTKNDGLTCAHHLLTPPRTHVNVDLPPQCYHSSSSGLQATKMMMWQIGRAYVCRGMLT